MLFRSRHPAYSAVRALAAAIAESTGARLGVLSEGANSAGAAMAGVLPHRTRGGADRTTAGMNVQEMLENKLDASLLFNVEPGSDIIAVDDAVSKLAAHKFVAAFSPYDSEQLRECADLLLPIGTFAESAGTYINCEGRQQSFQGVANPVGAARPGWKVLRVLGNLLQVADSEYQTSEEVRDEIAGLVGEITPDNSYSRGKAIARPNGEDAPGNEIDLPIYSVDSVVRRATALQLTAEARRSQPGVEA